MLPKLGRNIPILKDDDFAKNWPAPEKLRIKQSLPIPLYNFLSWIVLPKIPEFPTLNKYKITLITIHKRLATSQCNVFLTVSIKNL